jgi:hypothetical protein
MIERTILRLVMNFGAIATLSALVLPETRGQEHMGAPVRWERHFGSQELPYVQVAMAAPATRAGVLVCAPASEAGVLVTPATVELWRASYEGDVLHLGPLSIPPTNKPLSVATSVKPCLLGLKNGHTVLVIKTDLGQTLLVELNEQGTVLSAKDLALPPSVIISRIVRDRDDNYLLVGSQDEDAFAMKLDKRGEELWQNTFDRGRIESFGSAIPTRDGGCVLIGWSSTVKDIADPKASEVWVLRCDRFGRKQVERVVSGSLPRACSVGNDEFGLTYYKVDESGIGLWLEMINRDLQIEWARKVCPIQFPRLPFQVVSTARGFVVAGTSVVPPVNQAAICRVFGVDGCGLNDVSNCWGV